MAERGLVNYWGYNSIGFFAPHAAYSSSGDRGQQVTEFKADGQGLPRGRPRGDPRRRLQPHRRGRRRRTDAVASAGSTTRSTTGVTAERRPASRSADTYWDVTGCGNTVDAAHPFALRMILDSLRYWVTEMHVDGFRFDLLSALTRTGHEVDMASHLLDRDRPGPGAAARQADRRAVGRLDGRLPGRRVPAAVGRVERPVPRHDPRLLAAAARPAIRDVATRLAGSSDLYADDGRSPYASVNFVTAHDGFTLRDLVTYDAEAQRGQRRGQPGRHRQQPVLEPRRRGRDRRRGDRRAAAPAGGQPDGDAVPVHRRADDHRRRRARPHPGRQQQPLLPGQRDLVGRLAARRRLARRLRDHQDRAAAAPRAPGAAPAALVRGPADHPRRPEGPRLAAPRRAGR